MLVEDALTNYAYTTNGTQSSKTQLNYFYDDPLNSSATRIVTVTADNKTKTVYTRFPTFSESYPILNQNEQLAKLS